MEPSPVSTVVRSGPQAVPTEGRSAQRAASVSAVASVEAPARFEILRRADALQIPWERILLDEIQSEQALRRYAEDVDTMPLEAQLGVLSFSFLSSWRVRDEVQALSCAARGATLKTAVSRLRSVFRRLVGQPERGQAAFAGHLSLAYQRVLLLQRVCRAAGRSRGTTAERMASVCAATRCGYDDAAWALCREDAPRPGHRLDAAIRKAREEGFQIPRAATEARAFADLRRVVRAVPESARRPSTGRPHGVSLPARVGLPVDAI
jgi:hypothetical protein